MRVLGLEKVSQGRATRATLGVPLRGLEQQEEARAEAAVQSAVPGG